MRVPDVKLLCTIVARLDVKWTELPTLVNSDCVEYRLIEIDILMSPNGKTLDFSVYFQQRRLQAVS